MEHICKSGIKGWKKRLRKNYLSLKDLQLWDEMYGVVARLGYGSAEEAWKDNPMIEGSVNPSDFRRSE